MLILLDPAHGHNTPGKRSPDGTLLEYAYTRDLARQIVAALKARGYDSELPVPEDDDIPLSERVRRVNESCLTYEPSSPAPTGDLMHNVLLISIHINAAGDGTQWHTATGWSCYTCKGQTESDILAACLYEAAIKNFPGKRIRTDYSDNDPDWGENFYILRHSLCPAVLTENFFMDGLDMDFLQSLAGKQAIVDTHLEGITDFLKSISSDHHLRNSPTI